MCVAQYLEIHTGGFFHSRHLCKFAPGGKLPKQKIDGQTMDWWFHFLMEASVTKCTGVLG